MPRVILQSETERSGNRHREAVFQERSEGTEAFPATFNPLLFNFPRPDPLLWLLILPLKSSFISQKSFPSPLRHQPGGNAPAVTHTPRL